VTADRLGERSPFLLWLFGWYLRWYFRRHFRAVRISRSGLPLVPPGRPLIIYSNHPSWWDPALFILVGVKLLPERVGYGPMDASELRRYGLLRRMGVFGIDPHSPRGAAAFLSVGRRVLADPRRTLWVTAEGHFTDPRQRPVTLRPGIAHLARHVPGVVFLPLAGDGVTMDILLAWKRGGESPALRNFLATASPPAPRLTRQLPG